MAGKYSKLNIPAFQLEPSYQEKLDALIARFFPRIANPDGGFGRMCTDRDNVEAINLNMLSLGELGGLYKAEDVEADDLEAKLKQVKLRREAISLAALKAMEDDETSSFKLKDGTLFYTQEEPYASVKNKDAWMAWIKKKKLTGMLSVAWMSMNGIVKEKLLAGEPLPDGIEVFMKTSLRTRKGQ